MVDSNKQDTGLKYVSGNPIFSGDVVRSKNGYCVIVAQDMDGKFYGSLICERGHSCEDVPYSLVGDQLTPTTYDDAINEIVDRIYSSICDEDAIIPKLESAKEYILSSMEDEGKPNFRAGMKLIQDAIDARRKELRAEALRKVGLVEVEAEEETA